MKKSITTIAGGLMLVVSLFACAGGNASVYPTVTPARTAPRNAITDNTAPYHAAPRATVAPRTNTSRHLVPKMNTIPGTMATPRVAPYGSTNVAPRTGMTTPDTNNNRTGFDNRTGTDNRTGFDNRSGVDNRSGLNTNIAPRNNVQDRADITNSFTNRTVAPRTTMPRGNVNTSPRNVTLPATAR